MAIPCQNHLLIDQKESSTTSSRGTTRSVETRPLDGCSRRSTPRAALGPQRLWLTQYVEGLVGMGSLIRKHQLDGMFAIKKLEGHGARGMEKMTIKTCFVHLVSSEPADEAFTREFHRAGLRWATTAAAAGAIVYLIFLVISIALEGHSSSGIALRTALVAYLATVAVALWRGSDFCVRHYVPLVASTSAIALTGTVVLIAMQTGNPDFSPVLASPALMLGISLHYAVLRLPLGTAAIIGWLVAAAAMVWAPTVAGGSEVVRHAVYMAFANVFGMVFCNLVEKRERELYRQRKRSELAEATARIRQEASEEANKQKTRLIAAVSHDLRQPMTAALAHLEVVHSRLMRSDFDGAASAVERAQAAVSILGTTLDHLLTAARYDSGSEALCVRYLDLNDVLRDVYETYISEAERTGVRLRIRLPARQLFLETDARSITRVLGNLVSNAIKFSDFTRYSEPVVLVAARFGHSVCRIQVIDTGIGIDPDYIDSIWKPFLQLNGDERDRQRGLGLGLYLVRQIVDQLPGHTVSVRSRPGHGSTFMVTIPAVRVEHRPAVPDHLPTQPTHLDVSAINGAYLMVVEDDRDTRVALIELLETWGALTVAAPSFSKAEALIFESERIVDAIICDYRLSSGTNGIDAIAALRERLGYAPHAVLITGEPDIAPIRARAGPETTVLHKPFPPDSLARPLIRAVQAARQLEEG